MLHSDAVLDPATFEQMFPSRISCGTGTFPSVDLRKVVLPMLCIIRGTWYMVLSRHSYLNRGRGKDRLSVAVV